MGMSEIIKDGRVRGFGLNRESIGYEGWRNLAAAIIRQAYTDSREIIVAKICTRCGRDNPPERKRCWACKGREFKLDSIRPHEHEIQEFVNSGWCETLCEIVGLSHEAVKEGFEKSQEGIAKNGRF